MATITRFRGRLQQKRVMVVGYSQRVARERRMKKRETVASLFLMGRGKLRGAAEFASRILYP